MKFKYFFSFNKLEREAEKIRDTEDRNYILNLIKIFKSIVGLLQIVFVLSVSILLYLDQISFNNFIVMVFTLFLMTHFLPPIALKIIRR